MLKQACLYRYHVTTIAYLATLYKLIDEGFIDLHKLQSSPKGSKGINQTYKIKNYQPKINTSQILIKYVIYFQATSS